MSMADGCRRNERTSSMVSGCNLSEHIEQFQAEGEMANEERGMMGRYLREEERTLISLDANKERKYDANIRISVRDRECG
jgi:hypothetical protein